MLPTHDVPCPHCGAALYSATSLDDGINPDTPESPSVQTDAKGFYIQCPKCRSRVPMERFSAEGRDAFRLATKASAANRNVNESRP
jgi:DNA-directed RNA polymerase subunit RPC12/RpoP